MKKILILIILFFIFGLISGLLFNSFQQYLHIFPDDYHQGEVEGEGGENKNEILWSEELLAQDFKTISAFDINGDDIFIIDNYEDIFVVNLDGSSSKLEISWHDQPARFGDSGLLGLALHPHFKSSPFIYIFYTFEADNIIYNRLSRFVFKNFKLSEEDILVDRLPANSIRNGGHLTFDPDGYLLISLGDVGDQSLAQDKLSVAGKILRYGIDGNIPADNPVPGNPILALGLRQPGEIIFNNEGQGIFIEESSFGRGIQVLRDNKNYNWPMVAICRDIRSNNYNDNYCSLNVNGIAFCQNCLPDITDIVLLSDGTNKLKLASFENDDFSYKIIKDDIILKDYNRPKVRAIDNQNRFYLTAIDENEKEVIIRLTLEYKNSY